MIASHKTRDTIHANFSVTRKCHVSCHEGGVSRLASNTTKSSLSIAAPASTIHTSEGRRSLLSGPETGVSAPRVRRYHVTRRPRRASPSSSSSRVRFTPRRRRIRSARGGAHRFLRGRLLRRDARRPHLDDRPRRSAIGTGKRTRGIDDAQRRGVAPSGPPSDVRKPRRRPLVSPGAAKRR